ncbi:AAA family ATPase [Synechocystis salina LEGE 06099]|nr:AAA family ATPase [Synechocystis salina LEGE 06099]
MAIAELLLLLGQPTQLVREWLGPWLPADIPLLWNDAPPSYSKYQISGDIDWYQIATDLRSPLMAMGVKIPEENMVEVFGQLAKACPDEAEFIKATTNIKPLAMPNQFKDWANVIKPFQRTLSTRLWKEGKNEGDRDSGLSDDALKIAVKAYIAEKDPYKRDRMLADFYRQKISDKRLTALVAYEMAAGSTQRSSLLTPSEFRTLASEGKQWLVPSLFPVTGVTLLTAPPGGFKSTFAFDLAGSVINGTSFLGEPIKRNGPVVFACSDEPREEAQERATMQGFIHTEDYVYLEEWNIGQLDLLEEAIANKRPAVVIVDSYDSIHQNAGHDENSIAASWAIKQLNGLAKKYSTQIVVIQHENKDPKLSGVNKARGHTSIVAAANAHIRLLPVPNESDRVIVAIEKMRGGATRKILCDIDFYNVRFEPEINLEWEQQAGQREIILSFLQNNPGRWFEVSELNHYLGWAGKGIYKPLKQLSGRGEIMVKPNSMGRKGMVYSVPCTDSDTVGEQIYTLPPHTEFDKKENNSQTLIQQEIEDSHLLVTSQSPFSHLLVTSENLDTTETLTQSDSHLVTSEGGSKGGVCESTNLDLETVPQTKTEEITTLLLTLTIANKSPKRWRVTPGSHCQKRRSPLNPLMMM